MPIEHRLVCGDSRKLSWLDDGCVDVVCTSPPYFNLLTYDRSPGQLGTDDATYDQFLEQLLAVWTECHRVLRPSGVMLLNVGDVAVSRKQAGRHFLYPLVADTTVALRSTGLNFVAQLVWSKIGNMAREGEGRGYLGKPFMPNGIVPLDSEAIIVAEKDGPEAASAIWTGEPIDNIINDIPGAQKIGGHPAPYPPALIERLLPRFAQPGDSVLDVFCGTGTTIIVANRLRMRGIGSEVSLPFADFAAQRIREELDTRLTLFSTDAPTLRYDREGVSAALAS